MRILFVCLGNICRSPLAEGIFRREAAQAGILDQMTIDSAGTGDWHVGDPPDERAQRCAIGRGVDISTLAARQFAQADFDRFDRILVMDASNYENVIRLTEADTHAGKVRMMLDYPGGPGREDVPDPYFGGESGFDHVFGLLEDACRNLVNEIKAELSS